MAVEAQPKSTTMSNVALHPLPLLTISEHQTRLLVSGGRRGAGVLLGRQNGQEVQLVNSFDVVLDEQGTVDLAYLETRLGQYKQTLPELDILGFYTIGDIEKTRLAQELSSYGEGLLSLVLDTERGRQDGRELPFTLYEIELGEVVQAREIDYKIETDQVERIAIEGMSKEINVQTTGDGADDSVSGDDGLTAHLTMLRHAIEILREKIGEIIVMLKDDSTSSPKKDDVLRRVKALCGRLTESWTDLSEDQDKQHADILLISFLHQMTEHEQDLSKLVRKHVTMKTRDR